MVLTPTSFSYGDGIDEIIVGTGAKTKAIVNVFDDKGQMIKTFMPFGNTYNGGVDVAAGNLTGTLEADEIIVGPLAYGSSRTIIYDASQPGDNVMKIRSAVIE